MRTINFKKSTEKVSKSLKAFEMQNEDLQKIAGGLRLEFKRDENGNLIISPVQN